MKYWGYFRSSSSYRCRIAFGLKGVTPEFIPVHLKSGAQKSAEFAAINPQKLLPALETDAGDTLIQSLAILEWLDETIPNPRFCPPIRLCARRCGALHRLSPVKSIRCKTCGCSSICGPS